MAAILQLKPTGLRRLATFSGDRRYRYTLTRIWGDACGPRVAFILLNPSTADAEKDDPTIRKCIGYGRRWGFDGLEILNLFAWRSTDPRALRAAADPVGPMNMANIANVALGVGLLVCGWGQDAAVSDWGQDGRLFAALAGRELKALKLNADGSPAHPLYLSGSLVPRPFGPR